MKEYNLENICNQELILINGGDWFQDFVTVNGFILGTAIGIALYPIQGAYNAGYESHECDN